VEALPPLQHPEEQPKAESRPEEPSLAVKALAVEHKDMPEMQKTVQALRAALQEMPLRLASALKRLPTNQAVRPTHSVPDTPAPSLARQQSNEPQETSTRSVEPEEPLVAPDPLPEKDPQAKRSESDEPRGTVRDKRPDEERKNADMPRSEESNVGQAGVLVKARGKTKISPTYPTHSRRHNEEGVVTVEVEVLPTGKAGRVRIVRSSGFSRLDRAAIGAVKKATFIPATKAGKAVGTTVAMSFNFRLTD